MKKAPQLLLFFSIIFLSACIPTAYHIKKSSDPTGLAYIKQKALVDKSGKTVIGYKAGLTSKAGQAKFRVTEPVAGVLFKEGLSHDRQVYQLADYQKLMLETEIGFVLKSDMITTPYAPFPEFFLEHVEKIVPVIELPNLAYPDMSTVSGITLIETNVASNHVLVGKGIPIEQVDFNSINTSLTKNGQVVIEGKATDALGDQAKALQWLMLELWAYGYHPKKGDILITGALGKMIPAERGQYDADFGELGTLSFSIR